MAASPRQSNSSNSNSSKKCLEIIDSLISPRSGSEAALPKCKKTRGSRSEPSSQAVHVRVAHTEEVRRAVLVDHRVVLVDQRVILVDQKVILTNQSGRLANHNNVL